MSTSARFKLLTFNVHNLGRADNADERTYRSKMEFLSAVLGRLDPDVAVIDEVREPESFDELSDRFGMDPCRFLADAPGQAQDPDRYPVQTADP